jgi:hypothetical protein
VRVALLSVPYNIENVPHRTWMKALWMTRGDTAGARRLARLLDESILPIVEDGEKLFGSRVTARIILEKGVTELLSKIEDRQLGRLSRRLRRRVHHWGGASIPVANGKVRETDRKDRGMWLGLCGPDQVRWVVNGVRIPNEVIAEQTLRDAAAEGVSPPYDDSGIRRDFIPNVVSAGDSDGLNLEAYVKSHLRYCGRLPTGATYLGMIRSKEDAESARQVQGSFAIQDESGEWLLFGISLGRA